MIVPGPGSGSGGPGSGSGNIGGPGPGQIGGPGPSAGGPTPGGPGYPGPGVGGPGGPGPGIGGSTPGGGPGYPPPPQLGATLAIENPGRSVNATSLSGIPFGAAFAPPVSLLSNVQRWNSAERSRNASFDPFGSQEAVGTGVVFESATPNVRPGLTLF